MTETTQELDVLFASKDTMVRAIYGRLLDVVQTFGPFREEPKKTSIHLVNTSGFAGIHPRNRFCTSTCAWTGRCRVSALQKASRFRSIAITTKSR